MPLEPPRCALQCSVSGERIETKQALSPYRVDGAARTWDPRRGLALLEQLRVTAKPRQHEVLTLDLVDKQKVRPNVAFPIRAPFPLESMISVACRQTQLRSEQTYYFVYIFSAMTGS